MTDLWYDFAEHFDSIEWISELPKGLLSQRIDLEFNSVSVQAEEGRYNIYVGPKDPDKGGDGIFITLDNKMKLCDYVIERIEPIPKDK